MVGKLKISDHQIIEHVNREQPNTTFQNLVKDLGLSKAALSARISKLTNRKPPQTESKLQWALPHIVKAQERTYRKTSDGRFGAVLLTREYYKEYSLDRVTYDTLKELNDWKQDKGTLKSGKVKRVVSTGTGEHHVSISPDVIEHLVKQLGDPKLMKQLIDKEMKKLLDAQE